ncbi:hypothetical protein IWW38_005984, partial [Coemansia aciculifera]
MPPHPPLEESMHHKSCATDVPHATAELPPYSRDISHHSVADAKKSPEPQHFSAPSSSAASDIDESSAPSLADFAAADARLLDVNQLLLRRIRKLELTNQIVKEAYAEVQEMLQAERQSKITQLRALESKHEEDMERLVQEYQDRADHSASDSDSDSDYAFHPGFSTTAAHGGTRVPAERKMPASSSSSPL